MQEKMSEQKLREILETAEVDVRNGTLFGVAEQKKPQESRLTLIISTGGSGKSSIQEALRIAEQKLTPDYKTYVKFIMIDSSTNELEPYEKMGDFVKPLNLSLRGAVNRFKPENRTPFFKNIMPASYYAGKIDDHGAGKDRMTGRIKLYDKTTEDGNDIRLAKMIKDLFEKEWSAYKEKPVDIIILTGISGGNGSGTFLDLGVIARNACPNRDDVKVYAYIMLPDTVEDLAKTSEEKQTSYRNGFAALKELESYMSLVFEPEREEIFPSSKDGVQNKVDSIHRPFDYPVLISGKYEDVTSMIGETIVNLIADSGGKFDQRAFYSNLETGRTNALSIKQVSDLGILKNGVFPEDSHAYCGIGYAQASIPEKIIIPNLIGKIGKKLYTDMSVVTDDDTAVFCSTDNPFTVAQFERAMRMLLGLEGELTADSLWNKISAILESRGHLDENEYAVTKADILNDSVQEFLDGFNIPDKALSTEEDMGGELGELWKSFDANASSLMQLYGPRVIRFLYDGTGFQTQKGQKAHLEAISIKTMLMTVKQKLQMLASSPGVYPPRVERKGLFGELINFFTKGDENTWMGQAADAAQQDVYCRVAKKLNGGTWSQAYEEKVQQYVQYCERFADILDVMIEHYTDAGRVFDEGQAKFSAEAGEKNGVNLCQDDAMYKWVKRTVDEKVASIPLQTVKTNLVNDFTTHKADWISENTGVARARFDEVMSKSCSIGRYATVANGLNLSVADYFKEILKDVTDTAEQVKKIKNEVTSIISRLRQAGAPFLKIDQKNGALTNETILYPKCLIESGFGKSIQEAFDEVSKETKGKFYVSSVVDAIVCYQTSVANSISALKDLNSWEAAYENAADRDTVHSCNSEFVTQYTELSGRETDKARGLQMIPESTDGEHDLLASTGLSWEHYPSVNIKIYGDDFQKKVIPEFGGMTTESKYRAEVFDKKIEHALQEKIIECVCKENQYTYFLNTIPADWTDLSVEMYMADDDSLDKGKFKRGEPLFKYLAAQNPHAFSTSRKQIRLAGSGFFDHPFDFSGILAKEHWTPEMVTQKHRSYMKRIMRKNISLYRELEETLYRYEGIRSTLAAGELQYREAYQINLFLELFRVGQLCTDAKEKVWNVRVNAQGITQKIVEFSATKLEMLKGMEKGLWKDKLRLVLVYQAFGKLIEQGKLSLEELDETREKILGAMDEDEFNRIKAEKLRYLQSCYMTFAKKYGNKDADKCEKEMADAWGLKGTDRESVHEVVKVYRKIREMLEEEGIDLEAETVLMPELELTSETGWICPKCGAKHADTVLFCPNDATPKTVSAEPNNWICPKCGTKHASTVLFCPNDGTPQLVPEPEGWICPKCGTRHAGTVLFCPNDGTPQPVSEPEGWICPKCGTKHANTVLFCPNDGTPRSEAKPEGWICPTCGTKHVDTVLFCPNDGTRKPQ